MCKISITATAPAGVTAAEITIRAACGNCRYWELQHAHYGNLRDSLEEAMFQAENKIQARSKTKEKDNA